MPAILKILIVFSATLAFSRLRLPLAAALALGGLTLNLWAGLGPWETGAHLLEALAMPDLWLLLAVTALIIETGRFMTEDRNAGELVGAIERWGGHHGRALSLMALPAAIGLVPMPAGALFSAPFVEKAGGNDGSGTWKTAINYWFRHIWEYWWPLYPGVIAAMAIFDMLSAPRFVAALIGLTPVAAGAGYLFLIRPHLEALRRPPVPSRVDLRRTAIAVVPLAAAVLSLFVLPALPGPWQNIGARSGKLLALLTGLLAATAVIAMDEIGQRRRMAPEARPPFPMFSSLRKGKSRMVLFTLAGVLVFQRLLETSNLLPLAREELMATHVPLVVVVAALPFIAGLVTGLAIGFTGTSFPIVVAILATPESGLTPMATLVLAYTFGYMGMMLSPVHLCLLVSSDYFAAPLHGVYRRILPCAATVTAAGVAGFLLFARLGW